MCNHPYCLVPEPFPRPIRKPVPPLNTQPHVPWPPTTSQVLAGPLDLPVPGVCSEWGPPAHDLAAFTHSPVFQVPLCCGEGQDSFAPPPFFLVFFLVWLDRHNLKFTIIYHFQVDSLATLGRFALLCQRLYCPISRTFFSHPSEAPTHEARAPSPRRPIPCLSFLCAALRSLCLWV